MAADLVGQQKFLKNTGHTTSFDSQRLHYSFDEKTLYGFAILFDTRDCVIVVRAFWVELKDLIKIMVIKNVTHLCVCPGAGRL